jgi:hypothetical protein
MFWGAVENNNYSSIFGGTAVSGGAQQHEMSLEKQRKLFCQARVVASSINK